LALRVGVYRHQCVGSSGGGVVSVPWGCNEAVVYRLLPWMCWFFHRGGVVGAPSCGGGRYMVDVMVWMALKVQIVYVLGVECLVMWVFFSSFVSYVLYL
jgi:hypothetical protein